MTHGSLFSGIGSFEIASYLMSWKNVFHCEIECYQRSILKRHFPLSKSYEDIKNFDATEYKGRIDVLTGGFPCQDISASNFKAGGIMGTRSGLWSEYARIIYEIRPKVVVIENSPQLLSKGFERVLYDLCEGGYDAQWKCFKAYEFGLPHERERLFVIAYPTSIRQSGSGNFWDGFRYYQASDAWQTNNVINAIQQKTVPPLCESNNGFPERIFKSGVKTNGNAALHALGNAIVPAISYSILKHIKSKILIC